MANAWRTWTLAALFILVFCIALMLTLKPVRATPCPPEGWYWDEDEERCRRTDVFPPGSPPPPDDTATPVPPTATPEPTATMSPPPKPTEPVGVTATPTRPAARPTATPTGTPKATPTVAQTPPRTPQKALALPCLPNHAARPVALCPTGSGSGWWLIYLARGNKPVAGPHIPFPHSWIDRTRLEVLHELTLQPVSITWREDHIKVRTYYEDGKPYYFDAWEDGRVEHRRW